MLQTTLATAISAMLLCACGSSSDLPPPDPNFAGTWTGSAAYVVLSVVVQSFQTEWVVTVNGDTVTLGVCPGGNIAANGSGETATWTGFSGGTPVSCPPISVSVNSSTNGAWSCESAVPILPSGNAVLSNNTLTVNAGANFVGCGTTIAAGTGLVFDGIK